MTYFPTWKCIASKTAYNTSSSYTIFLGSSTCAQCGGGNGCTSMYKYMAALPTITGDYTQYQSYQNSTKCSSSVPASSVFLSTGYCASSSCAVPPMTDDTMSSSMPMMPSATVATCPNALATGTIKTGYAISSANYASTDTACAATPTSVSYLPVGTCFLDTSSDGTTLGSYMLTADSGNNIFVSYYDYSSTGNTCTGTPSVTTLPKQACTCLSDR